MRTSVGCVTARRLRLAGVVALAAQIFGLLARAAHGQVPPMIAPSARLQVDNDFLALRGSGPPPDYDYTHGTRLGVAWPSMKGAFGWHPGGIRGCATRPGLDSSCFLTGVALTQEIYTPRHNTVEPVPGDRPYAAWSYALLLHSVSELSAAAGWRAQRFALEYRYVSMGREYRAEPGRHAYGSIAVTTAIRH